MPTCSMHLDTVCHKQELDLQIARITVSPSSVDIPYKDDMLLFKSTRKLSLK
jgi:hypothetical protein